MAGPWDTLGGDYTESELMDRVYLTVDDALSYIDFELDPDYVEDMIRKPSATKGFILKLQDGDQSVVSFNSSETTDYEPFLTVYYH